MRVNTEADRTKHLYIFQLELQKILNAALSKGFLPCWTSVGHSVVDSAREGEESPAILEVGYA